MYLLDDVLKIEEGNRVACSYLIENGQVRYITKAMMKWKDKKMSMNGTVMMNGRVMLANSLLDCESFTQFKEEQTHYIDRGCTTIVVAPFLSYERQLEAIHRRAKHNLANSTLDYLIGLTIPIRILTPSLLRRCRKLYIPFIQVEIQSLDELAMPSWTHLSQTLAYYQIALIPMVKDDAEKANSLLLDKWLKYCCYYDIHTTLPIEEKERWKKVLLQMVGLYPKKGVLAVGSDADYLLFPKNGEHILEMRPNVVIVKGNIIKANTDYTLKPGYGKQLKIKQPGRFLSIDANKIFERL